MSEAKVTVNIADFRLELNGQSTIMSRKPTYEELTALKICLSYIGGVITGLQLSADQK
jgi:hypothetical protein